MESVDQRSNIQTDGSWQQQAACRGMDTQLFFPARGESSPEAEAACADCPVQVDCAEFAIASGQRFGIWGGTSERQRRRIRAGRAVRRLDGAA